MVIKSKQEVEMSLINDYSYQVMTDQRERDLARLAENNRRVRLALSGRVSLWRRLQARREQRISTVGRRPEERGMATPQHRVAH
jgi:hypothetical protein